MVNRPCTLLLLLLLAATSSASIAIQRIAIDVGHSKQAPGAISAYGETEFSFNKNLAQRISNELSHAGIATVLIGSDGNEVDLMHRTELASAGGATFFLSVHHDSVQPNYLKQWQWHGGEYLFSDNFSGFSLFVSRLNTHLDESLRCAAAIGHALIADGFHYSDHHAESSANENKEWADKLNGIYYYDNLAVLRTATQPAVLLEAGIIVNRKDALDLKNVKTQQRIAHAVHLGLIACGAIGQK